MTTLATNIAGLPIFADNTVNTPLFETAVVGVATDPTVVPAQDYTQTVGTGEPEDPTTNNPIPQPADGLRVTFLVTHVTRNAAIVAAAAATRGMGVVPAPAVNFGRTPARVDRNIINYQTKEGLQLYRDGATGLYRDGEEPFGLSSANLHAFLNKVDHRKTSKGWEIFMIPNSAHTAAAPSIKNLTKHHGQLKQADVQAYVTSLTADSRETQEDAQLFECLWNSITTGAQGTLSLKNEDYTIAGETSGVMFLFAIIQESTITTKSTTNHMWAKLTSGMPDILAACGNNVAKFNEEIRVIQTMLVARGEDPSKILPQLFSTYKGCESVESAFGRFMENLEFAHDQGTKHLSVNILMTEVETKYKALVEQQKFKSGSGKPKDDFVALQAGMQAQIETLTAQVSGFRGTAPVAPSGGGGTASGEKKPKPTFKDITTPPKEGEPLCKLIKGKWMRWCDPGNPDKHRPKWVRHAKCECGQMPGTVTDAPKGEEERTAMIKRDGTGTMGATATRPATNPAESGGTSTQVGWSTALMASMYEDVDE